MEMAWREWNIVLIPRDTPVLAASFNWCNANIPKGGWHWAQLGDVQLENYSVHFYIKDDQDATAFKLACPAS